LDAVEQRPALFGALLLDELTAREDDVLPL